MLEFELIPKRKPTLSTCNSRNETISGKFCRSLVIVVKLYKIILSIFLLDSSNFLLASRLRLFSFVNSTNAEFSFY